jgi:D-sedoheptulose 7-phosphate isomerase
MMNASEVRKLLLASAELKRKVAEDPAITAQVARMADMVFQALKSGRRIYLCGNGGSAADAQHIAAEFVSRFQKERAAWPAEALTTNTSILTALGNDYSFDVVFSRQVEAMVEKGDVLIALSTSGTSRNVIKAVETARAKGAKTIGLTGSLGKPLADACDECLMVPTATTCRVQEVHIAVGHVICDMVEVALTSG